MIIVTLILLLLIMIMASRHTLLRTWIWGFGTLDLKLQVLTFQIIPTDPILTLNSRPNGIHLAPVG